LENQEFKNSKVESCADDSSRLLHIAFCSNKRYNNPL
jgi:hypothetical protein